MDIMCLMGLFPDEYKETIFNDSISGVQNAANKLQWNIVNGLSSLDGVDVTICNSLYIGTFPKKYKKMYIPSFRFAAGTHSENLNVGFCNLPFFSYLSKYWGIRKFISNWARAKSSEEKVLLVYALTIPFAQIAEYVEKKFPYIKICVIVPDLPEFMNVSAMQTNPIYATAKKAASQWIRYSLRNVNHFVLLTEQMKEWFGRDIQYTVVEGMSDVPDTETFRTRKKDIIYAGELKKEYGVVELVEAFHQTTISDWSLYIYGDGSAMNELTTIASNDPRIKIMGLVPNSDVIEHQKKASLLINPRKNQEFSKYSFPSKILEYMASGTPMLAYKLEGVPSEYDDFYFSIKPEETLKDALIRVMCYPSKDRQKLGYHAKIFVASQKNPTIQCKKILHFLN